MIFSTLHAALPCCQCLTAHFRPFTSASPNGTSRLRNQRKVRKTLAFSKATRYHRWMCWVAAGLDNFCHAHRSLQIKAERQVAHQSPAMAAK